MNGNKWMNEWMSLETDGLLWHFETNRKACELRNSGIQFMMLVYDRCWLLLCDLALLCFYVNWIHLNNFHFFIWIIVLCSRIMFVATSPTEESRSTFTILCPQVTFTDSAIGTTAGQPRPGRLRRPVVASLVPRGTRLPRTGVVIVVERRHSRTGSAATAGTRSMPTDSPASPLSPENKHGSLIYRMIQNTRT